jgi:hypothetical protein
MGTCVSQRGLNYFTLSQVKRFLRPYMAARRILLAQGLIMNVENTSPFSPNAPWKRQDLHHVGKEDSEKLGGVYLFTILWFNVHTLTLDNWERPVVEGYFCNIGGSVAFHDPLLQCAYPKSRYSPTLDNWDMPDVEVYFAILEGV